MSEVILVLLRYPERAPGLLRAAGRLAEVMGQARVNALAVREAIRVRTLTAEALMGEADALLEAEKHERQRVATLKAIFGRWADEAATEARWSEAEGSAAAAVAERGCRADVIVAERPAEDDREARQAFRAALFGTDRPVLMVPPGADTDFGYRVAIAWRDDKQAARAVVPALRWLEGAGQVHVLMGVRDTAAQPRIPSILTEHGIAARLHVLPIGPGPFGQALLDRAHEVGADLLVMGAYAHRPLRELILGGVTRYMLARADLPVFMRH